MLQATQVSKKKTLVNQVISFVHSIKYYAATKMILQEAKRQHGKVFML